MSDYKFVWDNVLGHSAKIDDLRKIIADGKFPHAVIFSGVTGIGKRKVAEICAATLLCENPGDGNACGSCPSCKLMSGSSHPDFYVVEPEETKTTRNIKIAQIRTLQSEAVLKPLQSSCRVVLIDGAEFMNNAAANCLLKTLEEPPSQTIFILTTANRAGLLMTMRSRCLTMNFDKLSAEDIVLGLIRHGVDSDTADKISLIADGSLGRAITLTESGGYEIRETAVDIVERLCRNEVTNEDIFAKGTQIAEWSREQFGDFIIYIQKILRDIYMLGITKLYNVDFTERLGNIRISEQRLYAMIAEGVKVRRRLNSNANLKLLAESYLMRLRLTANIKFSPH